VQLFNHYRHKIKAPEEQTPEELRNMIGPRPRALSCADGSAKTGRRSRQRSSSTGASGRTAISLDCRRQSRVRPWPTVQRPAELHGTEAAARTNDEGWKDSGYTAKHGVVVVVVIRSSTPAGSPRCRRPSRLSLLALQRGQTKW
jgi:hypothetical protein